MIKPRNNEIDVCVATRLATGFRAGCYYVKGKCGINQKVTINSNEKWTRNIILLHQSLMYRQIFYVYIFISNYMNSFHGQKR